MENRVHIGLTFYGGVSLAVFEAGVAYELVRAVQYCRENKELEDLHIDVISGTSAGGLTVVQLAAALAGKNPDGVLGKMVSMWANTADVSQLLPEKDFNQQGILDNRVIKTGIEEMLRTAASGKEAPLEEDLDLLLTVTNFTGLREPVFLPRGEDGAQAPDVFPTTRHCEYERFSAADINNPSQWPDIVNAAACTAGFPVAFPPIIKKSRSLPEVVPTRFIYVDGGVKDNWPLGIALEAISRRPAPNRKFLFVDPNDTYAVPEYGLPEGEKLKDDPYTIYGQLLSIARADTIYWDLENLRQNNDRLDILNHLSHMVFEQEDLCTFLTHLHSKVALNAFNHEARALWLMIEINGACTNELKDLWEEIQKIARYTLRARALEYLRLAREKQMINEEKFLELKKFIDQPERWKAYYEAIRAIEAHASHFRNLRYRVWRAVYRSSDGRMPEEKVPEDLVEDIKTRLEKLLEDTRLLKKVRMELADEFFRQAQIPEFDIMTFYKYAEAMQVLESLADLKIKGRIDVGRITPFDIYKTSASMRDQHPLAGGSLGAFGGFLSKDWRINDFMVGRLAMRRRLCSEGLIPEACFKDYVEKAANQDKTVVFSLAFHSKERMIAEAFRELGVNDQGPYGNDCQKPENILLRRQDMTLDAIPPSRLCFLFSRISHSLRGLFQRNGETFPYSILKKANGFLILVQGLCWLLERTIFYRPRSNVASYIYVLLLGLVIGAVLALVLFR